MADPVSIAVIVDNAPIQVEFIDQDIHVFLPDEITEVVLEGVGPQGPQGQQGERGIPGTSAGAFEYTQSTPSDEWHVHHNIGQRPSTEIIGEDGEEIVARVRHIDNNYLMITFSEPVAGTVRCN